MGIFEVVFIIAITSNAKKEFPIHNEGVYINEFYIASGFQNKQIVRSIANELKHAGWHHTYDWTKNERAVNQEQLREIGEAEKNAIKEADVFLLILDGGNGSHTEFGMAIALEKRYMYIMKEIRSKQRSIICQK